MSIVYKQDGDGYLVFVVLSISASVGNWHLKHGLVPNFHLCNTVEHLMNVFLTFLGIYKRLFEKLNNMMWTRKK